VRLLLSLLCLGFASPALAQETTFNLHQAVLDAIPIEEARSGIETIYGPLRDFTKDLPQHLVTDAVTALATPDGGLLSYFVFCDDKFAGFTAVVSPKAASELLGPLTLSTSPPVDVFPDEQGVTLTFPDANLIAFYTGIGTKQSYVTISYPHDLLLNLDFAGHCADLAGK